MRPGELARDPARSRASERGLAHGAREKKPCGTRAPEIKHEPGQSTARRCRVILGKSMVSLGENELGQMSHAIERELLPGQVRIDCHCAF